MKNILWLILINFVSFSCLDAQRIYGAEVYKEIFSEQVTIQAWVWRQNGSKPFIMYDWGDGSPLDSIDLVSDLVLGNLENDTYRLNIYRGVHNFDTSGILAMGFRDSFLIGDIVNIENSAEKVLTLYDTVNIFPANPELQSNTSPVYLYKQGHIRKREDGSLVLRMDLESDDFDFLLDIYDAKLAEFPAEGFSFPESTDSLYMAPPNGGALIWDRPLGEGRYAVGINDREYRRYINENGQIDTAFLSTTMRAMVFLVTEDLLVHSYSQSSNELDLSLFPNPATSTLHLQLQRAQSTQGQLQIENLSGQTLYTEALNLSPSLQSWQVDVADWPSGVYVVRLQAGTQQVVRKFVVE
ncbi:MAG: T9SS type A sorting domain-containing protein [Phaeodactylibacter sp.]|nr:T9SS type A sorting domain-containing protein [Phaeodactylibacter sp.]